MEKKLRVMRNKMLKDFLWVYIRGKNQDNHDTCRNTDHYSFSLYVRFFYVLCSTSGAE